MILGKRGLAVSCDANYVGNATSLSPPLRARERVGVTGSLISGNRPGREQGGEQEEDVEGRAGGRKATVKLKDKKRNGRLEAGRDVEMDDRHMEDIRKG